MNFTVIPQPWAPILLSVLRIMTGLLFLEHGTGKLLGFPHLAHSGTLNGFVLFTGLMELIGGALITVGLFTRPAAFILSGYMAVAYFMAHFPKSFFPILNSGEAAVFFCFIFLYIAAAGPGPWAIDRD